MWSPLWSNLVCKIPQFFAKSYRSGQLFIIFYKVDTLRLLKIYIMFCPPARAKYKFFQAPSNGPIKLNIAAQKRTLKYSSPRSNFVLFNVQYNLNDLYFRENKRLSVLLDFIVISNLIAVFRTVAAIYAMMTHQKVAEKTAVHIEYVKLLHGCRAWKHLH